MKTFKSRVIAQMMAMCLLFTGLDVLAEDVSKQSNSEELQLETITVTAQKQEEKAQEVPMGITVLDTVAIEDGNVESIRELADFVPNFLVNDEGASGANSPSMRGIYAMVETRTSASALFVDGVPILTAMGFEDTLLDIERVEILRGPQGTLYGKNTEAGAISIITRQPDNNFRAKISGDWGKMLSAEAGNQSKQAYTLNFSGPIQEDRFFYGIAGKFYQRDGYIENTNTGDAADDRKHWFGRLQLRWTPSDKLDISLITARLKYDEGSVNMRLTEAGASMFGLSVTEDRKESSNLEGFNKSSSETQSLKVRYNLSDLLTVTSVTARRVYNDKMTTDWDFSPMTISHSHKDNTYTKLSQELRLDYSSESLQWLIGLYSDNDMDEFDIEMESDFPQMAKTIDRDFSGQAQAVFGQVNYSLTSNLNAIGGLRYENQDQEYENHVANTRIEDSWNEVSPKLALEYDWEPDIMTYASVSKGYRSGGFNVYATNSKYATYDEEKLISYEIGLKSLFQNNRIMLNGAVFLMDITDMQVSESVTPVLSYLTNAGEATSKGIELEMMAKVSESLKVQGSLGYLISEFDDFEDSKGDYKGNKVPFAPDYNYNIGAQYRFRDRYYARADVIGYGEMYLDKANDYKRDPYQIVNARVGYEMENLDIYLYGKNIFDEEYNVDGFFGGYYVVYSDPGEFGLQVTYRY